MLRSHAPHPPSHKQTLSASSLNPELILQQPITPLSLSPPPKKKRMASWSKGSVDVVLGVQWGDEGKGKLVDVLAQDADVCCRFAGGNNAGHTIVIGEDKYDFHLLPSGIGSEGVTNVIGNGVVVHLPDLFKEIESNLGHGPALKGWEDRLVISDRAHLVLDLHQAIDGYQETARGSNKIGTTKKGIGPCYAEKMGRRSLRMCDLVGDTEAFEAALSRLVANHARAYPDVAVDLKAEVERYRGYAERVRPMVKDTITMMHRFLREGKTVLAEGANATMLDIDFGTYPYVTSSSCSVGGVCTGLGVPPQAIRNVYGVSKAYCTRVGEGGFPTELTDAMGEAMREAGHEFGTTTGRPRRCGWIDIEALRYACDLNGISALCLTKLDVMDAFKEVQIGVRYLDNKSGTPLNTVPAHIADFGAVKVEYETMPGWETSIAKCRKYEELPQSARKYVERLEELLEVPIKWIGVGPGREELIQRQ